MNLEQFLEHIQFEPSISKNITQWRVLPERTPEYADFPPDMDNRLKEGLKKRGIKRLYIHQRESWDKVSQNKNIVVVTPTASGKTLCYNLPVLDGVLKAPQTRALYLFPTKALSQDQRAGLQELIDAMEVDIKTHTYDGDTPGNIRKAIRTSGHIVITNPDMLHRGILPHHTKWIKLFENLKFIIIDELHQLRGIFGSHVGNLLRRLKRICNFYGSQPQFICCSATIKNPDEMAERLTGEKVELINRNGAPTGEKHIIFYNPPIVNFQMGIRRSALLETKKIAGELIRNQIQTLVFTRTRLACEVLTTYLKDAVSTIYRKEKKDQIRGYRGGYLPQKRREIEKGLREGEVLAVVSTNALELGVDIGNLDSVVICGYPGTISSTWQQSGRAGRRQSTSSVFMVATASPLDQFIITHPEYFFGENVEQGLVNPDNLYILVNHIKCAAFELPFNSGDIYGKNRVDEVLEYLEGQGILRQARGKWYWSSDSYPAQDVSLRSAMGENFVIIDISSPKHRVIGEVDRFSAPMLLHEEAIYLHESEQFQVEELDFEEKKAYVRAVDVDYYTDANMAVDIKILSRDKHEEINPLVSRFLGDVQVNALVTMFKKIKFNTHENIGSGPVHLPEQEFHTTAYWLSIDPCQIPDMTPSELESGLLGVSNLLANLAPLYLMCDPKDLNAVVQVKSPFTERPTIFIYDSYPGGIGLSERLYSLHHQLLKSAKERIEQCYCSLGCPSCVGPMEEVGTEGKKLTQRLLELIQEGI